MPCNLSSARVIRRGSKPARSMARRAVRAPGRSRLYACQTFRGEGFFRVTPVHLSSVFLSMHAHVRENLEEGSPRGGLKSKLVGSICEADPDPGGDLRTFAV